MNWIGRRPTSATSASNWQITYIASTRAVATDTGAAEPQTVGIEVADSGIPRIRSTLTAIWALGRLERELDDALPLAPHGRLRQRLRRSRFARPDNTGSGRATARTSSARRRTTTLRVSWKLPVRYDISVSGGINNIFDKDPPICLSCSLNGYDASTYDLPGRFCYVEASVQF